MSENLTFYPSSLYRDSKQLGMATIRPQHSLSILEFSPVQIYKVSNAQKMFTAGDTRSSRRAAPPQQ